MVLAAMRDWVREHGQPPRIADWARADRRRWPPPSLAVRLFEGWSEALAAAGLTVGPEDVPNASSGRAVVER